MMIVIGLVSGFSMNEISDKFIKGCKPMIYASFITGLASAIAVILNQGKVLDTIVYALSIPLNQVGAVVGAGLMVVVNVIVNIFIPSGSGQAAVMIPLMTPIADLVGITRQVAVQALPVWRRPVQPAHPAERTHDGLPGHGRHQLPQVHQVGIQVPDDEHRRCHRDHHGAAGCGLGRFLIPV